MINNMEYPTAIQFTIEGVVTNGLGYHESYGYLDRLQVLIPNLFPTKAITQERKNGTSIELQKTLLEYDSRTGKIPYLDRLIHCSTVDLLLNRLGGVGIPVTVFTHTTGLI